MDGRDHRRDTRRVKFLGCKKKRCSTRHEAQRLYPAYVGTQRVASAMQAVQYGNAQGAYGSQGNRGRSSKSTAAMSLR